MDIGDGWLFVGIQSDISGVLNNGIEAYTLSEKEVFYPFPKQLVWKLSSQYSIPDHQNEFLFRALCCKDW